MKVKKRNGKKKNERIEENNKEKITGWNRKDKWKRRERMREKEKNER